MDCSVTAATEMSFDTTVFTDPPVALPAAKQPKTAGQPRALRRPALLLRAHAEAARTNAREDLVWLTLAFSALLLLFFCA